MTYYQDQGYIQIIIMEDTYGQDIVPRPRVYTDHHHGDKYGQDVLTRPRVYTDHHGDTYGQDVLPWPRLYTDHYGDMLKTYCQDQGYIQIIFMETHNGHGILSRPRVCTDHHH
jgi:hypothetical protein